MLQVAEAYAGRSRRQRYSGGETALARWTQDYAFALLLVEKEKCLTKIMNALRER